MVHLCYVDESGDAESCGRERPDGPPVFALVGVTVPQERQKALTWDFLQLKKEFEPSLATQRLSDLVRFEIKGASIRRDLRRDSRKPRRRAERILDSVLSVVEKHECQLIGKVVTKREDGLIRDAEVYPKAIRQMAETFEAGLAAAQVHGMMILDSRTKTKNEGSVHGITTQRFKTGGDMVPHLLEAPVFGHSDTHVPLQIADILASALVFPIACHIYCSKMSWNHHVRGSNRYEGLRDRYGARLQNLEYRYLDAEGTRRGGFQVEDRIGLKPTHHLFRA